MRLSGSSPSSSPLSSWTASSGMACICTPGAWGNMRKFSNKRCLRVTDKKSYYYTAVALPWISMKVWTLHSKLTWLCFRVSFIFHLKKLDCQVQEVFHPYEIISIQVYLNIIFFVLYRYLFQSTSIVNSLQGQVQVLPMWAKLVSALLSNKLEYLIR